MINETFTPAYSRDRLVTGNNRFVNGQLHHPHHSNIQRLATLRSQQPYAVIVTCSDSRVAPELIFDCGIGDLFVVRIAGNIVSQEVLGTVEFAVVSLGIPLVMVIGHRDCVAVRKATLHAKFEGAFQQILNEIEHRISPDLNETEAILENAQVSVRELLQSPILSDKVKHGLLEITAGYYDNETGWVNELHP